MTTGARRGNRAWWRVVLPYDPAASPMLTAVKAMDVAVTEFFLRLL